MKNKVIITVFSIVIFIAFMKIYFFIEGYIPSGQIWYIIHGFIILFIFIPASVYLSTKLIDLIRE